MAEDDINITYETLFDITRKEKMQEELQKLHPNFFNHVYKYIAEKETVIQSSPTDNLFARDEKLMNQKQLENIRRLVTELYARRERKIMNLAIIKSRTNSRLLDTSSLLEEEQVLFNHILHVLNSSKKIYFT
jgi:DNA replication initiation complex subunit (GINS family)